MSPHKSRLLLLDTVVIIEAFRIGIWKHLVQSYNVLVTNTVVSETLYYFDNKNIKVQIDLEPFISRGTISCINITSSETEIFIRKMGPDYAERIHAGELELLTYLDKTEDTHLMICSADKIIFMTIGKLLKSSQGLSLSEVLTKVGIKRKLEDHFCKGFRDHYTNLGFKDSLDNSN